MSYDAAADDSGLGLNAVQSLGAFAQACNRLRAGRSYAELARAARPQSLPAATLSDLLNAKSVPTSHTMILFLRACGLVDEEAQRPWLAALDRVATGQHPRPAGSVRVREARPRLLGVHASIRVAGADGDLPVYVRRDVDAELRAAVDAAATSGGFVLVKGSSSVGKTRALFEAVRAVLPDWWLLHPRDAAEVRAFADAVTPRTVLWLDELQRYLDQPGGIPVGVIRTLLTAKQLVVGTLWPGDYTIRIGLRISGQPDRYAEDRELLGLARIIEVADTFSVAERKRAEDLAADPRIRTALNSSDAGVTQILAAGPELIRRWENADVSDPLQCYGKAVISAALDARRVGVVAPLSEAFLVAAAPAYIGPALRAAAPADWFGQAISYANSPLHGATACLIPSAAEMGKVDGWNTADYLHQHAMRARRSLPLPNGVWQALVEHHNSDDTYALADSANRRGQNQYAEALFRCLAVEDPAATMGLADLLADQGRVEELAELAATGSRPAVNRLRDLQVQAQLAAIIGLEEAADLLSGGLTVDDFRRSRDADELTVLKADSEGSFLANLGNVDELRRRADAADRAAAYHLAELLVAGGQRDELRLRAHARDPIAARRLAILFAEEGHAEDAIVILRPNADDRLAGSLLIDLLSDQGLVDELRQKADAGDSEAAYRLVSFLVDQNRIDELRAEMHAGTFAAAEALEKCTRHS